MLHKADENRLVRITDLGRARDALLACVIRPAVDRAWWEKTLAVIAAMVREIPCYELHFDRSGAIVPALVELARGRKSEEGKPAQVER